MPEKFFIRPAVAGARLHDPSTNDVLAAEGEMKPRDHYWLKCLVRGDVVEAEAPKEPVPPAPPKAPVVPPAKPVAVAVAS